MAKRKSTSTKSSRRAKPTAPKKTASKKRRPRKQVATPVAQSTSRIKYQVRMAFVAASTIAVVLLTASLVRNISQLVDAPQQLSEVAPQNTGLYNQLRALSGQVSTLEATQTKDGINVADTASLEQELATVQVDLESNRPEQAQSLLTHLHLQIASMDTKVTESTAGIQPPAQASSLNVPILLYHNPPSDFAHQMDLLQKRSYTTVTLDELAAALIGGAALPPKPVIITFDDGLESQMPATSLLASRHMKATFFIIDGGAASNYCIGANRHPGPCGDAYLTWKQIKQLDHNSLFTIASHTVDHLDLAQQSASIQSYQIISGKRQLEQQLGHQVDDFAYPYGAFNATTIGLVHQAGFVAAVTTVPGTIQTADSLLTLKRVRSTYDLP